MHDTLLDSCSAYCTRRQQQVVDGTSAITSAIKPAGCSILSNGLLVDAILHRLQVPPGTIVV